jgi:hypothetical protein
MSLVTRKIDVSVIHSTLFQESDMFYVSTRSNSGQDQEQRCEGIPGDSDVQALLHMHYFRTYLIRLLIPPGHGEITQDRILKTCVRQE